MNFITKLNFESFEEIKNSLMNSFVVHAIPRIKIEELESFYFDLICYLGSPFLSEESLETSDKTGGLWSDIKYSKNKSDSFLHSNTRQPFHTDGAYEKSNPDISFFYCIEKAKFGGATIFAQTETVIDCLKVYDEKILNDLKKTPILHRKGNDGKTCLILDNNNWNWNFYRAEKIEIVHKFHYFLEEIIYKSGLYESVCLLPGESLFFWDKKVLHGRNAFLGDRHLRKAGLNLH